MGKNEVRIEQEEKNKDFYSDVTFPYPFSKKLLIFFPFNRSIEILNF